jgi:nitrate/nitrite transport system substrate-binding protein
MDNAENRIEVVELIAGETFLNVSQDSVKMSMTGKFQYGLDEEPRSLPDFNVFHRYAANFPWLSHAEWLLTQMYRWGQIDEVINIRDTAAAIYRPDIYRQAADRLGEPYPTITHKVEGQHQNSWQLSDATDAIAMGADSFLDGKQYDPQKPVDYLADFEVAHVQVGLQDLAKANR